MISSSMRHILICAIVLAGCANNDMSDIDQFLKEKWPRDPVKPLPEIPTYETFRYAAVVDKFRDPFAPIIEEPILEHAPKEQPPPKPISTLRPDFNRNREPLERYPLDSLRMAGTIKQRGETWGVVRSADGIVYRVRIGNYLGQNHGRVVKITEDRILLTEIIPDGSDGWLEHQAGLALSE